MRQWWLGLVVGAGIGGATGAGVAGLVPPRTTVAAPEEQGREYIHELQVGRLLVLAPSGRGRVRLQVADSGAEVVLPDPNGKPCVGVSANGSSSNLSLTDPYAIGDPPPRHVLTLG